MYVKNFVSMSEKIKMSSKNHHNLVGIFPIAPLSPGTTRVFHQRSRNMCNSLKASKKSCVNEEEQENEAIQFWKVYFEFAYHSCVCPFRYVWDTTTKSYLCYTNLFQTVSYNWIVYKECHDELSHSKQSIDSRRDIIYGRSLNSSKSSGIIFGYCIFRSCITLYSP